GAWGAPPSGGHRVLPGSVLVTCRPLISRSPRWLSAARDENDLLRALPLDDRSRSWRSISHVPDRGDLGTIPGLIFGTAFLVGGHDRAACIRRHHRRRWPCGPLRRPVRRARDAPHGPA